MCWVMPPASVATTAVSRIASSSVVLPWSTWPMIVTIGGRSTRLLGMVLEDDLLLFLVVGMLDRDLALELARDQLDGVVGERHRQRHHLARPIISVMILAGEMPSFSARSLTVMPGRDLDGSGRRLGLALGLGPRCSALAAHGRLAAGLGVDHDAALALGAAPRWGRGARPGWAGRSSAGGAAFAPNARCTSSSSTNSSAMSPRPPSEEVSRCANLPPALRDRAVPSPCIVAFSGSQPRLRASLRAARLGAQIHPAPGQPAVAIDHQFAVSGHDSHQLALRPAPAAARALPHRRAHRGEARPSSAASAMWAGTPQ